jgi:O-antigen/teichoic acid export membrane protein
LRSRTAKNIAANWLGLGSDAIFGFLLTPFLLHRLGDTAFGIWVLMSAFTGYYGLLEFGTRNAVIRYVARYHAQKDHTALSKVIGSTVVAYAGLGGLVFLVSMLIAWRLDALLAVAPEWIRPARILLVMFGIGTAVGFPISIFGGVLEGLQRFSVTGSVQAAAAAVRTVVIVIAVKMGFGLLAVGAITLAVNLSTYIIFVTVVFHLLPHLRLRWRDADLATLRMLGAFGIVTFFVGIAHRLRFQSDAMVIGAFLSAAAVSYFAVSSKLVTYSTEAVQVMAGVFTPRFSELDATGSREELRRTLLTANFYSSLLSFPVAVALILLGKGLILAWVGENYLVSYPVLVTLAIPMAFYVAQAGSTKVLYGMARHKVLAAALLAEGIVNVVLSIILLRYYGIWGAALGTAIPLTVTSFLFLPFHVCRHVEMPVRTYFVEGMLKPLLPSIPLALLWWAIVQAWPIRDYVSLFAVGTVGGLLYLVTVALFFKATGRRLRP